jgi:hypothetical protein
LEIQVLVWNRHIIVVGLNWIMESQPSSQFKVETLAIISKCKSSELKEN